VACCLLLSSAALSCEAFVAQSGAYVAPGVVGRSVNVLQGAIMPPQHTQTGDGAAAAACVATSRVVLAAAVASLVATSARRSPGNARRGSRLQGRQGKGSGEKTVLPGFVSKAISASRPYISKVTNTTRTNISKVITEIRMATGGRRKELEANLLEAQKLTALAEERAQTLETTLEAELKEERQIKDELTKQIENLQSAYTTIADKLELQEVETTARYDSVSKMLEEATKNLAESREEEAALLERLEKAEEIEKKMEEEQKKLIQQLDQSEKELAWSVQEKESMREQLAEEVASRIQIEAFAEAKDAEYQIKFKELQAQNDELTSRLSALQEKEDRPDSDELTQAHADNKLLEEQLQAAERRLEELLKKKKEKTSSKGAGKGDKKGVGKGAGKGVREG